MFNQGKFRYVKIAILLAICIDSTRRLGDELGKHLADSVS